PPRPRRSRRGPPMNGRRRCAPAYAEGAGPDLYWTSQGLVVRKDSVDKPTASPVWTRRAIGQNVQCPTGPSGRRVGATWAILMLTGDVFLQISARTASATPP